MPATWENDTSHPEYHRDRAKTYFDRYIALQHRIEALERLAAEAAPNKRAHKYILTNTNTDGGFEYKRLCGERDMCMAVAQLSATMAAVLRW